MPFALTLPVLFAVFVWWFSTGLILLLDGLPRTTFRWSLVVSSTLAAAALIALQCTADDGGIAAAYCAFTCALLVWGWHELSFLTGWITGPRRHAAAPGARGWRRFVQATQVVLWHELGIAAAGVLIVGLTWGGVNQVGTWTFAVLWAMRTSAKLNLFLGVRNLSEELLPPQLAYLESYFRRRPLNPFFPVSVTASTAVAAMLVLAALDAPPAAAAGLMLVASMLSLGIVEHWLLVLPLPVTALWRWAMRRRNPAPEPSPPPPVPERNDALLHAR